VPARVTRSAGRGKGATQDLVLVPVCEGKITLVVRADGGGGGAWAEIERLLRRLRFDTAAPACRFVHDDTPASP
jgi:hypothetical protein